MIARTFVFAALALAAGCAAPAGVATLAGSTAPVRAWFGAHDGSPRALLLLSPT